MSSILDARQDLAAIAERFQAISSETNSQRPDLDFGAADHSFREMLMLANLSLDSAAQAEGLYVEDWSDMSREESVNLTNYVHSGVILDVLLKSTIVFADIANIRLLQTAFGHEKERNVHWLSTRKELHAWTMTLKRSALIQAHALRSYRNKLILHFDVPRSNVSQGPSRNLLQRRLVPVNFDGASPGRQRELSRLRQRYAHLARVSAVEEVAPQRWNYFELLEALFYSVPPLDEDGSAEDRKLVDKFAQYGGIKSPSILETAITVVDFAETVCTRIDSIPDLIE